MNRRKVWLISLVLVCLLGIGIGAGYYGYYTYIRTQNVFDQMYYSRTYPNSLVGILKDCRSLFRSMPEIRTPPRDADEGSLEFLRAVAEVYRGSYLEEGQHIRFMFYVNTHLLSIDCWFERDDGPDEWGSYLYDVDEKTLSYHTDTPENQELKNFLFDRVLPDWFNANGARTRFSLDDLGYYTFVEIEE